MQYDRTLTCALAWAKEDALEAWVHAYLLSDGDNLPFSEGLRKCERRFLGPYWMPLRLFCRCAGPVGEGLTYSIHPEVWERNVCHLMDAISGGEDLAPLIVNYVIPLGSAEGHFELNDGNHRWEAYHRLGISSVPVLVWVTTPQEEAQFLDRYSGICESLL